MKENDKKNKIVFLTGIITAITTFTLLNIFLDGKIIEIPKDTLEGRIITIVGYGTIMFTTSLLAFVTLVILKKKSRLFK
ncbi:hypothetical protein K4L44_09370 [Halosquirtibacter laminarini]|uniref:Uncharacterized protein n=1 Tax=Halosquirtibacter laminarini TaxID=3374600 RepID=A0AC61NL37_9BACT|nr:hypothetical protein K4L44_09370 [Prolixibacteraceae bacterium]